MPQGSRTQVLARNARLNMDAIAASLRALQREFERINRRLRDRRDPMSDAVVDNMLRGYALVDTWVAADLDVLAMGNLKHLLALNEVVLCGNGPGERTPSQRHIEATERRFYEEREGGIEDIVDWLVRHKYDSVWKRAAGAYVRILSKPQLFIEGNHRTGALVMSYLLLREGKPPFVLTIDNAEAYFDPSTVIRDVHKKSLAALFRLPGICMRFARFLRAQADMSYLLDDV